MDKHRKDKLHKRIKLVSTILKFALLLGIIIGLPLYIYFYQPQLIEDMSSMENVNAFFRQYHAESIFVYIGAQILQIVICVISRPVAAVRGRLYVRILAGLPLFCNRRGAWFDSDLLSCQTDSDGTPCI